MYSPLLNSFIFICKTVVCISVFVSLNTHHWIRDIDGKEYRGMKLACYDYGHHCFERVHTRRAILFCYIVVLASFVLELLNIILLYKRPRSRINLVFEELTILAVLVFLLPGILFSIGGFILIGSYSNEQLDWSSYVFFMSVIIALIDLICSLVRVVSYCRQNSFRSNAIIYTSNNNDEIVRIQS